MKNTADVSPIPAPQPTKKISINTKIITILILVFICYTPTLFIQDLISDRIYYQKQALEHNLSTGETKLALSHQQTIQDHRAVTRASKYSLLFITLTFSLFFLFEVLNKIKIHPVNYGLVGLALAVFYLLLLSFSEIIGFIPAYAIAVTAVVSLISTYMIKILKSVSKTAILATLLLTLYGYLLVLLQLDQYSLLFGSLLVFATLATLMLSTRNIDWYDV